MGNALFAVVLNYRTSTYVDTRLVIGNYSFWSAGMISVLHAQFCIKSIQEYNAYMSTCVINEYINVPRRVVMLSVWVFA